MDNDWVVVDLAPVAPGTDTRDIAHNKIARSALDAVDCLVGCVVSDIDKVSTIVSNVASDASELHFVRVISMPVLCVVIAVDLVVDTIKRRAAKRAVKRAAKCAAKWG